MHPFFRPEKGSIIPILQGLSREEDKPLTELKVVNAKELNYFLIITYFVFTTFGSVG